MHPFIYRFVSFHGITLYEPKCYPCPEPLACWMGLGLRLGLRLGLGLGVGVGGVVFAALSGRICRGFTNLLKPFCLPFRAIFLIRAIRVIRS